MTRHNAGEKLHINFLQNHPKQTEEEEDKTLLNQTEWPSCWPWQEQKQNRKTQRNLGLSPEYVRVKIEIVLISYRNRTGRQADRQAGWQTQWSDAKGCCLLLLARSRQNIRRARKKKKQSWSKSWQQKKTASRENVYASVEFNALVTFDHSLTADSTSRRPPDGLRDFGLRLRIPFDIFNPHLVAPA